MPGFVGTIRAHGVADAEGRETGYELCEPR
jgi:hypothetical protein